jgi:hypothetical protein
LSCAQADLIKKVNFPQFEECEADNQFGQSCFENTFISKFKTFYKETEIAKDYKYKRALTANIQVDRRGIMTSNEFSTAESPIFVSVERAVKEFEKLIPAYDDKNRPEDFNFQVKFSLSRSEANSENALNVEVEFVYLDTSKDNL